MAVLYDIARYLPRVEGLFPLPQILARAAAKARDPASTMDEVADLLMLDPAIVRSVIRLSNSSYFNLPTKSESLKEAVQRVGLGEILRLVSCSMAQAVYQRELTHYRIPPEVFWESAIAAAFLMAELAREQGGDADEAYLAGLMREIGMVVIDHVLTAEGSSAQWDCYEPLRDWEQTVCGHSHPAVGADLLARWGFTPSLCAAVRQQWEPAGPSGPVLARSLRLTNLLLERCGCDFSLPLESSEDWHGLAVGLGLEFSQVASAQQAARDKFRRLRAELGPTIGPPR